MRDEGLPIGIFDDVPIVQLQDRAEEWVMLDGWKGKGDAEAVASTVNRLHMK